MGRRPQPLLFRVEPVDDASAVVGDIECAGRVAENYFIFPNGRVYRCPLCEDFPLHSLKFEQDRLVERSGITERGLFGLDIPEGCVMNKLVQPDNLSYDRRGRPYHRVACCLLKTEISPR